MFFKDYSKIATLAAQSSETRLQRLTAEWIAREINAAQQSVHLTAFGVGLLAFCAGFGICWLVFVR